MLQACEAVQASLHILLAILSTLHLTKMILLGSLSAYLSCLLVAINLVAAFYTNHEPCKLLQSCCVTLSSNEHDPRKTYKNEVIQLKFYYNANDGSKHGLVPEWLSLHSYDDDQVEHLEPVVAAYDGASATWVADKVAWLKVCVTWNGYDGNEEVTDYLKGEEKIYWVSIGDP